MSRSERLQLGLEVAPPLLRPNQLFPGRQRHRQHPPPGPPQVAPLEHGGAQQPARGAREVGRAIRFDRQAVLRHRQIHRVAGHVGLLQGAQPQAGQRGAQLALQVRHVLGALVAAVAHPAAPSGCHHVAPVGVQLARVIGGLQVQRQRHLVDAQQGEARLGGTQEGVASLADLLPQPEQLWRLRARRAARGQRPRGRRQLVGGEL
mmetsp:Transcript_46894/g.117385  ORF Transcript_46894/g.117385 Transcript_46894/m.117385 type:complete len:205 (-) Transcript_46894:179-793(-)